MVEKWEGFTPEEILKIADQKQSITKSDSVQSSSSPVKKMTFNKNKFGKKNITRERMLKSNNLGGARDSQSGLPHGARLFIPQIPEEDEVEEPESYNGDKSLSASPLVPSELSNDSSPPPITLPELLLAPRESNLEDFEKRQKMIQEQNRLRKEYLKKALEDRTKKTYEEAKRLGQIEEELKKLDMQLSNDISILRNQIEVASLEFMEAQKRFDVAEREYLDAKLALFTKRERKELLTGHLCTIIEQNELRKAKKLSDLMEKLQLGSVVIEKPFNVPEEEMSTDVKEDKSAATEAPS